MASKRGKWILIIVAILLVAALWIGAIVALIFKGGPFGGGGGGGFYESVLEEGNADKVAVIPIEGVILPGVSDGFGGIAGDDDIVAQLDAAYEDPSVVAIILDLDTPGGEVVASNVIHRKVTESPVPVVALMGSVAASGGYYIAAASEEIVANPDTITGSIGVILTIYNLEGAAEKLGIREEVIKSGPNKDLGSSFRDLTPEERDIFQGLIDESYGRFVDAVVDGRGLTEVRVRELADGRIYSGSQGEKNGLVDTLGGQDEAFETAKKLADSPGATLVRYEPEVGLTDLLNPFGLTQGSSLLQRETGIDLRPGLKYLWVP